MAASTQLVAFTLDDFEARTGSAASIIRTIAGLYLRHEAAPVARTRILALATAAGVSSPTAQTAISRLADRGVLEAAGTSSLQVTAAAQAMFARGDRRIFTPRQMADEELWCLVAYSLPETMRPLRHQVRKHFLQLGGGLVNAGLWIFPGYLREEVLQVLGALEVRSYATVFTTQTPDFPEGAMQAARQWWDLGRLESMHSTFLESTAALDAQPASPAAAYRGYVAMVDAWRALPYLDPGLPDAMLPGNWPGRPSRERFLALSRAYGPGARHFATALLEG